MRDAGSNPAAATLLLEFNWFDRWLLPVAGGLFLFRLEKRVFSRFKTFLVFGGIIYHLANKNRLNRKFDKNNFVTYLCHLSLSLNSAIFFSLKINNLQHFLKNFEKKSLPV